MLPSWPNGACDATLNGSFVAVRVAAEDMYPNLSAQAELSQGNGNQ
jgi:hypothetical protein